MRRKKDDLLNTLRTVDDVAKLVTGKNLSEIVGRAIELFGEDALKKVTALPAESPEDLTRQMPYIVLGISSEAPDFLVKAAWKAQLKEFHPDTHPGDTEKAAHINNAYDAICQERGIAK